MILASTIAGLPALSTCLPPPSPSPLSLYNAITRHTHPIMATHTTTGPAPSLSNLSLSSYSQSNHIDLTADDDEINDQYNSPRLAKRPRTETSFAHPPTPGTQIMNSPPAPSTPLSAFSAYNQKPPLSTGGTSFVKPGLLPGPAAYTPHTAPNQGIYRPAFAGPVPSNFHIPRQLQPQPQQPSYPGPNSRSAPSFGSSSSIIPGRPSSELSDRQVIDLTGSPSPPPAMYPRQLVPNSLPPDLAPKTPVCIGQLTVTALVLYPVPYLLPQDAAGEPEWAPVRLQYEHNPNKPGGSETIHIKAPHERGPHGETIAGEGFGVVEQKVATSLGPMLGKGLIRLDAKVRKGQANVGC